MLLQQKLSFAIALTTLPFLYLLTDLTRGEDWLFVLANLSGFLGAVVLWWQFAFGVRPIARLFSVDYASLIKVHIWLGTYGLVIVLLHGVLEMFEYSGGLAFLFLPSFGNEFFLHLSFGQTSFWSLFIIWITSAVVRSSIKYRPWKYVHYLSYPAGALVYIHALDIGTYLGSVLWLQVIWYAMAISYLGMMAYRLVDAARLTSYAYTLSATEQVGEKITTYTLTPTRAARITPAIGQYVYVSLRRFGETHPFSIMGHDAQTGTLTLGIKQFGPFTEKLAHVPTGAKLYISQPYGVFTREAQTNAPRVLIAGGIGVTPFIPLIEQYPNDTYLFNCNTSLDNVVKHHELQTILEDRYYDIVAPEQINADAFLALPAHIRDTASFFICGPAGLMNAVKEQLASIGVPKQRIFTEEFSF